MKNENHNPLTDPQPGDVVINKITGKHLTVDGLVQAGVSYSSTINGTPYSGFMVSLEGWAKENKNVGD